ncbi:MAG: class I SAM-dependent methyltransferase [Thermodesulfobacteriota bacterium]
MKRFRQRYYDYFSRIYDRFITLHSTDRALSLGQFLADTTGLKEGDMVLDICTGTGSTLKPLKERVQTRGLVAGIDFSIGMLTASRSKIPKHDNIFLVLADAASLPFKKKVFNPDYAVGIVTRVEKPQRNEKLERLCAEGIFVNMLRSKIVKRALQQGFSGRSRWLLHNLGLMQ